MAESRTFSTPSIVHVRPSVTALRRTQRNNGAITICGQLDAPNRERGLVTYGMPQLHGLGNAENTPAGFGQGRPLDRLVCIISIHGVQYKRWQRFDVRFSKVVVGEHAIWGSSAWHGRNSNDLERNSLWITNGDGSSYHRSFTRDAAWHFRKCGKPVFLFAWGIGDGSASAQPSRQFGPIHHEPAQTSLKRALNQLWSGIFRYKCVTIRNFGCFFES